MFHIYKKALDDHVTVVGGGVVLIEIVCIVVIPVASASSVIHGRWFQILLDSRFEIVWIGESEEIGT